MRLHFERKHLRYLAIAGLAILLTLFIGFALRQAFQSVESQRAQTAEQVAAFNALLPRYEQLNAKIEAMQAQGVDVTSALEERQKIVAFIQAGDFAQADATITSTLAMLDTLLTQKVAADEAQKAAEQAAAAAKVASTPSPTPKPVATTSTTTTASSSTAWTRYELKTVSTAVGTFTVHVITADIGAGKARLVTDTANDTDCTDNCPTLSVASFVSRNGGVAGMNGTYFCPPDYSWCAGKVNTFLYRIYNSRLGKLINATNDATANDPVIAETTGGTLRYFSSWSSYASSGISVIAAMNSGPALVANGQVVVDVNKLDDKQRYTKSNRGALGFTGSALLAVVGKSATVTDMAYIMDALGLDYAMNLDGGGSSAMYYSGSYKVGPGRSLPNAVVIDE